MQTLNVLLFPKLENVGSVGATELKMREGILRNCLWNVQFPLLSQETQ